jgi:hypothetical protein
MKSIDSALEDLRGAARQFTEAAARSASAWNTPRAPGKWSPAQLTEHVARSLDESANEVAELPCKFPRLPALVRPLLRAAFFNRVVRTGHFPRGRTARAFNPIEGAPSPAEGRARLEAAAARLEQAARACATEDRRVRSGLFGSCALEDYVRFQALHTQHHRRQFPGPT